MVNYVDFGKKSSKINWHISFPERKREIRTSIDYDNIGLGSHRRAMTATKISGARTLKGSLISLGESLTRFESFARKNKKNIFICLLVVVAAFAGSFAVFRALEYRENSISPLVLQNMEGENGEFESLNRLMNQFAMNTFDEINESGDISVSGDSFSAISFDRPVTFQSYKVQNGDTISGIAKKFGLYNVSTLISVNDISNVRTLAAGQKLKIPSTDGILYTVKPGESLGLISKNRNISVEALVDVNDLDTDVLTAGQVLFLPGAKLDQQTLSNAMGDQFILPIKAKYRMSSHFGPRLDPFTGLKSNHKGNDYACPTGTPVYASKSGKVVFVGESWLYGKHVILDHGNGYQTLYAHLSQSIATKGTWVSQGTKIGLVGSTGYSTGPHLHFTVYKNGKPINPDSVLK